MVLAPPPSTLRGRGRSAYRAGHTASGAVQFARQFLFADFSASERAQVMAGWAAERGEAVEAW